jgi:hypothetical protein
MRNSILYFSILIHSVHHGGVVVFSSLLSYFPNNRALSVKVCFCLRKIVLWGIMADADQLLKVWYKKIFAIFFCNESLVLIFFHVPVQWEGKRSRLHLPRFKLIFFCHIKLIAVIRCCLCGFTSTTITPRRQDFATRRKLRLDLI